MSNEQPKGYGVCRSVEDAHTIAAQAKEKGVGGCYPSAAVTLSNDYKERVSKLQSLVAVSIDPGNGGANHYMRGMANGMLVAEACFTDKEPTFLQPEIVKEFDYQAEAMSTASNQFHGGLVSLAVFEEVLGRAVAALDDLDAIKKTLFYGKPLPSKMAVPYLGQRNCMGLPDFFKSRSFGELALHGIIGSATECGEQLETIFAVMRGETLDEVNIKEEVGDSFWYNAILLHAVGATFEEVQRINIEKLKNKAKGRYKSGTFTETAALQRDLVAEREILEK